jgi:hypothetical protein
LKGFLIDARRQELREIEWGGPKDLARLLGTDGRLQMTPIRDEMGDWILTADDAWIDPQHLFQIAADGPPLPALGIVIGPSLYDELTGAHLETAAPTITLQTLRLLVRFMTRDQAFAWADASDHPDAWSVRHRLLKSPEPAKPAGHANRPPAAPSGSENGAAGRAD